MAFSMIDALDHFAERIGAAVGFTVAFLVVTAMVIGEISPVKRIDEYTMTGLARRRADWIDAIVAPLATFATLEPLTIQAAIAFAMIVVTIGLSAPLHFALAAVGSGLLSHLIKRTVGRPRPVGFHLIRGIRSYSYPSGDLLTASAIYLTIALVVSPHLPHSAARWLLFGIVTILLGLLAVCRVYAGVHYPSDVAGGALLGLAWALFISAWFA
jgi:membrane-associated phospholipid phosphatase